MIHKIRNEAQYKQVMALIEKFIKKATESGGFNYLSGPEKEELSHLNKIAGEYEDDALKIMPLPLTINSVVLYKIRELNLTQAKLAKMLGLGTAKLSQILTGKREPDVMFLKAIHNKLGISGDFLLENV
jgi:HTH-type transcriptional regulator / antitoxin HigA